MEWTLAFWSPSLSRNSFISSTIYPVIPTYLQISIIVGLLAVPFCHFIRDMCRNTTVVLLPLLTHFRPYYFLVNKFTFGNMLRPRVGRRTINPRSRRLDALKTRSKAPRVCGYPVAIVVDNCE